MTKSGVYLIIVLAYIALHHNPIQAMESRRGQGHMIMIIAEEYLHPSGEIPKLSGLRKDLEHMSAIARIWEIPSRNILTLRGSEPTRSRILTELNALASRVGPEDWVVIYYSGHGTSIPDLSGDERDKMDEAWCPVDIRRNERYEWVNILSDDLIAQKIDRFATRNVLLIIDSCHSGSAAKSLPGQNVYTPKIAWLHPIAQQPEPVVVNIKRKFISIAACADDELTWSSGSGSLFTRGLLHVLQQAHNRKETLDFNTLIQRLRKFIRQKSDSDKMHHPQLDGDDSRFHLPIYPIPFGSRRAATPPDIKVRPSAVTSRLKLKANSKANSTSHEVGDFLKLELELPFSGYLNIVCTDPAGNNQILFPNHFQPTSWVPKQKVIIPSKLLSYQLELDAPGGTHTITAMLSREPLGLYDTDKATPSGFQELRGQRWRGLLNSRMADITHEVLVLQVTENR